MLIYTVTAEVTALRIGPVMTTQRRPCRSPSAPRNGLEIVSKRFWKPRIKPSHWTAWSSFERYTGRVEILMVEKPSSQKKADAAMSRTGL